MPRQLRVYQYDPEGQLTDAWYNAVDPAGTTYAWLREDHFNYDPLGNRRGTNYVQTHGVQAFSRKNNGLNQYSMWSPFSLTRYDDDIGGTWGAPGRANGVLMQEGNITAGYNALNQAIMINTYAMGSNWMFFGYDPVGRRVKRWTGPLDSSAPFPGIPPVGSNPATYYYYDGWSLIEEGTGAGSTSRNYIHGARVDEIVKQLIQYNPSPRFFHYDARGHCTLQTDASGNIAEQYEYDAFGYPYFFNASGTQIGYSPWGNRFLFTGREWLSDVKLYDYRNRMYQPELGRFLQPDPKHFAAGDYNLYRYCHNDPINKSDSTGLSETWPWSNWDYAPPVAFVHGWFDVGAGLSEGLISLKDAMDTAQKAGQARKSELVGIGEDGPVPDTLGGNAVRDALPEIAQDIQTAISGIPGTSFTGPPAAPTSQSETVGTAVAGTVIGLGTRAAEMETRNDTKTPKP